MEKRFYLDTSIWRDYFEDRSDGIRPLGEFAFQFLKKCLKEKYSVLVSDKVEKELLRYYSREKVNAVFSNFKEIIIKIKPTRKQVAEAGNIWIKNNKEFPLNDILHAIIARDANAILVSRDFHFRALEISECRLPEEID